MYSWNYYFSKKPPLFNSSGFLKRVILKIELTGLDSLPEVITRIPEGISTVWLNIRH